MKRRLGLTHALAATRHAVAPFAMVLGSALLLGGCLTDVDDEYADETDDFGYARHDLAAQLPVGEGEGEGADDRATLPTAGSSVDVADEEFDSLFEPQPQPWDGEEGMQESGNGDQGGE